MRSFAIKCITLAVVGLTRAQIPGCGINTVDFENLTAVSSLGPALGTPIANGYAGLNWANLYGATPNVAAQFILPQGKNFAASREAPATIPVVISTIPGRTINPKAVFIATAQRLGAGGLGALPTASIVTVTATFKDGTTAQTVFNFDPPTTVFGLAINAEAMQYNQFPCGWKKVVSLSFKPQTKNGLAILLGLVIDNFQYVDDTAA